MRLTLRRLRLRAVWLLVVPFLVLARPTPPLLAAGGVLALVGAVLRGWAAGTIHKERELSTTGPYAHTRNPLYLGSFLAGSGLVLAGGRWVFALLFGVFFVWIYGRTIRAEAHLLAERFGARYAEYARSVPQFIPRLTPYREEGGVGTAARFSFERWRRNREYEALLGLVSGLAFLTARMLLG